ncbi:hypothetical protein J1N35_001385 [Gossypium stocksii]|uniref:Uncharacterized protein n=1 Tax=Gossypium stocksii TaxID=47602 RepID=A0A9D4AL15_9ROSI|nr:hypothetical protein J1N35_001385 [Gossypium stocksii]
MPRRKLRQSYDGLRNVAQLGNVKDNEAFLAFKNGLEMWVRQDLELEGVQELSKAMMVTEPVVKLGLRKDKLKSSNSKEIGICEENHEEDNGNRNDNGGINKPRKGKRKPNNPKKKRDKMRYFLCESSHVLKRCLKRSMLSRSDKPKRGAERLGSSVSDAKANEAKKLVECFLCHGLHRLQNCSKNIVIKGDDGLDKAPKRLGSNTSGVEAKG